tara:strand:+ start:501 stop:1355 length:855 start_codon:yes stop_codon:yes gene_type:complete
MRIPMTEDLLDDDMELLGSDFPYSENSLTGRHAMVCGASRGIGAATAKMLAKAGADVTICARNQSALEELKVELSKLGTGNHQVCIIDLEDTNSLGSKVQSIIAGNGPIHILVNNAGGPPGGPLINNEIEDFEAPFKRHLHASHTLVQLLAPQMKEENFGRIIQIISTSVKEPIPNIGLSNTLRGAMASWAKSLSRELDPCITINNVLPGFTDTERLGSLADSIHQRTGKSQDDIHKSWIEQVPIGRLIDPLETASAILFLALPASGGIRGVSLAVDGGRLRGI